MTATLLTTWALCALALAGLIMYWIARDLADDKPERTESTVYVGRSPLVRAPWPVPLSPRLTDVVAHEAPTVRRHVSWLVPDPCEAQAEHDRQVAAFARDLEAFRWATGELARIRAEVLADA